MCSIFLSKSKKFSIGCGTNARSSPRGYGRILIVEHRLKNLHISEALSLAAKDSFILLPDLNFLSGA
jgi:hypothetical protein